MSGRIETLWPAHSAGIPASGELSDADLADRYRYPALHPPEGRWVRANFVASLDGAAAIDGRSEPLSSSADRRLFRLLRALADVILVGAGTVRAEGYGSTHLDIAEHAALRVSQAEVPPIAVVTRSGDLDPGGDLFTGNIVAPIVLTCRAAPADRLRELKAAGADIGYVGDQDVSLPLVFDELARRGLGRILCEGGPRLFANAIAIDAIDEVCLTISPTLAGGSGQRIAAGAASPAVPTSMALASVLVGDDNLLLRYVSSARSSHP